MTQVPTGIIQLATHPPFGVLQRENLATPLTYGVTQCRRIRGPVNVDAFGMSFDFFTIPAAFGWEQRVTKRYEHIIVQMAPLYTDFAGHDMYGPIIDINEEGQYYYFGDLLPTRVDVFVQVGCVVIGSWLVAL
jgi:hypothetical protein